MSNQGNPIKCIETYQSKKKNIFKTNKSRKKNSYVWNTKDFFPLIESNKL